MAVSGARVTGTVSAVFWDTLEPVWGQLGFADAVPDAAFKVLALALVIEPTSKLDSARVLAEVMRGRRRTRRSINARNAARRVTIGTSSPPRVGSMPGRGRACCSMT